MVVEGGSRLAAVPNTADWYQHLHLGMNSLMLMESMIRADQAVGVPCCRRGRAACYAVSVFSITITWCP